VKKMWSDQIGKPQNVILKVSRRSAAGSGGRH
jgi:hypothetical protein